MDRQTRGAITIMAVVIVVILIIAVYGCTTGAWE